MPAPESREGKGEGRAVCNVIEFILDYVQPEGDEKRIRFRSTVDVGRLPLLRGSECRSRHQPCTNSSGPTATFKSEAPEKISTSTPGASSSRSANLPVWKGDERPTLFRHRKIASATAERVPLAANQARAEETGSEASAEDSRSAPLPLQTDNTQRQSDESTTLNDEGDLRLASTSGKIFQHENAVLNSQDFGTQDMLVEGPTSIAYPKSKRLVQLAKAAKSKTTDAEDVLLSVRPAEDHLLEDQQVAKRAKHSGDSRGTE
ncbi:hypothetical protein R1sor_018836 [Riccia sorocarpa]|uniref:Uncharacterized protein n=1 Tax=Riccia sorocarpa TaxID=122646 RepID=A0ABD3IE65_9MARC